MILEPHECFFVCVFFLAAVLNYHKPDGLKQYNLSSYSSLSQKSNTNLLGLKFSRESTEHSMCLPFTASRSCSHSLTHGPFFTCKASMLQLSNYASVVTSPSDHSQGKFSAFNDLCVYTKDSESKSEVAQSCPTLCDRMDCSLLGCSIHGILQARILKWVAISFSRGSSRHRV